MYFYIGIVIASLKKKHCSLYILYKVSLTYITKTRHYENKPIQIYWKYHLQKLKIFR